MKKLVLSAMMAALFVATPAFARLGQSREFIESIRGRPVSSTGDARTYQAGGWRITVVYEGGKSAQEAYSKIDRSPLKIAEIVNWLRANVCSSPWSWPTRAGRFVNWKTSDNRSRLAVYDLRTHALVIATFDYVKKHAVSKASTVARLN
jgi:hypothetical protein